MNSNDLTLAKLSKATGVPKQTIHNWLTGIVPNNLSHVRKLAEYFNMSIEELCFGEPPKASSDINIKVFQDEINAGVFEVVLRKVKQTQTE